MKKIKLSKLSVILSILLSINIFVGCSDTSLNNENEKNVVIGSGVVTQEEKSESGKIEEDKEAESKEDNSKEENSQNTEKEESNQKVETEENIQKEESKVADEFEGYRLIEVYGGDLSGHREPNVVVDIGFGDREYYAFTNEYGQLVKVIAKE